MPKAATIARQDLLLALPRNPHSHIDRTHCTIRHFHPQTWNKN